MKRYLIILLSATLLYACHNSHDQQQIKNLSTQDSLLNQKTDTQASTIMAYIKSFNDIESNLDSIKAKSKILTLSNSGDVANNQQQIISNIREIGEFMLKNKREIALLESRLRKSNSHNRQLQEMIAHLTEELNEKDAQIAALQSQLAESNAALKDMITQFNDSMEVVSKQKTQINQITTQMNTVYYAIGTKKELKKKGVITKEGGIVGIGAATELKQNFNTSYFTKADMTTLHAIALYSKFEKLVTNHPSGSYTITDNNKSDSLIIKDPKSFWSESKYLVVIVK